MQRPFSPLASSPTSRPVGLPVNCTTLYLSIRPAAFAAAHYPNKSEMKLINKLKDKREHCLKPSKMKQRSFMQFKAVFVVLQFEIETEHHE